MIWQIVAATMALTTTTFAILWIGALRSRDSRLNRKVTRLRRRVGMMASESLPQWAEQALGETGRSFSAWRRSGERVLLDETYVGAEAIVAVLEELQSRSR